MRKVQFAGILCAVSAVAVAVVTLTPRVTAEQQPALGEQLVRGLLATPGCLGVQTAATSTGRNAIFAWFEDKAAVKRWYYSETHKGAMAAAGAQPGGDPLEHVSDDAGPIMVIASLVFTDRPMIEGLNMPISSISIELYEALPGGAFVTDRFAPPTVAVPHMKDLSPN